MKLYTVGPCQMFESTKVIGAQQVPYFRNQAFSEEVFACMDMLKRFANAAAEDKAIILTASGTGAMEAVVMNCLTENDRVLVINGGSFGQRFSDICTIHRIPHDDLVVEFGETLTSEMLEPYEESGYTALLVNLDETSTGQLYDGRMLGEFCRRNNMLYIVDAISAFGSDVVDIRGWGISAMVTSSQKALSLPPGLSFVIIDADVYERRVVSSEVRSMYFDFRPYVEDGLRGQTPFTPAVQTVLQLRDILERIQEDGGIDAWVQRTHMLAEDFRSRLEDLPVELPSYPLSNAVTPIIFKQHDARQVNAALEEQYGFIANPCGGTRATTMTRIAHIGNHSVQDNEELVHALRHILAAS